MAIKTEECNIHSQQIAFLQRDVVELKEHNKEALLIIKIGFEELNLKVRKLEDRSLIAQFFEKILWLAVGAFITVLVHQNYIAVNNKQDYSIEKTKQKNR